MSGIYDEINSKRYSEKEDYELSPKEIHARAISRRGLYEEEQIKAAVESGENPIELSIKKWRKIQQVLSDYPTAGTVMGLSDYIGYRTCALCLTSIKTYKAQYGDLKDSGSKCTVCPLAKIQACVATDSYYAQIDDAVVSATYRSAAGDEGALIVNEVQENIEKLLSNLEKLRLDT